MRYEVNDARIPSANWINVLHVGPGYGQRGGIASVLGELAARRASFERVDIGTTIFETHGFKNAGSSLRFFSSDMPKFISAARGVDVVHFHVSERGSFYRKFVLYMIAKAMRRRVVFHLHSGNFDHFVARADGLTRAALHQFIGGADAVIGTSSASARLLNQFRRNADDTNVIANFATDAEHDAIHGGSHDRPRACVQSYIAFAGRLSTQKGVDVLIEALGILARQGFDIALRLAGEGDTERWRGVAHAHDVIDRVHFEGWLEGDDKLSFYRNAFVFCLPSQFEAFGIAALEAMFCGVPVVATRVGGLEDLVSEGVTGYLVPPNDAEAVADRVRQLLENPALATRMKDAALSRAKQDYVARAISERYVRCYRGITNGAAV
ncbi:glycosyltransferase family 4 protein [Burkholderia cepacia]|uniref:glycosyltransferase family 4 protein n=1 Tax=Burkholderia cepacia TaxID=292 RepID=UPI002019B313|nr:glycosyltransferase family 4 protein [Burkholderia cepacia]UQO37162.1 glycosyltransferase family 4 protein [Burkholderia cepacia]UQO51489.1 glycosyltransferase family 4 protein [Burkholderia cepacia]UQP05646.1 glycosyltransferase family 4 protein [Burkholderia cepacia]